MPPKKKGSGNPDYWKYHASKKMREERQQRVEQRRVEQDKAGNGDRKKGKAKLKDRELQHGRKHASDPLPKRYKVVKKAANRKGKGAQPKRGKGYRITARSTKRG